MSPMLMSLAKDPQVLSIGLEISIGQNSSEDNIKHVNTDSRDEIEKRNKILFQIILSSQIHSLEQGQKELR